MKLPDSLPFPLIRLYNPTTIFRTLDFSKLPIFQTNSASFPEIYIQFLELWQFRNQQKPVLATCTTGTAFNKLQGGVFRQFSLLQSEWKICHLRLKEATSPFLPIIKSLFKHPREEFPVEKKQELSNRYRSEVNY